MWAGGDEEAGREGLCHVCSFSLPPVLLIFSVLYCECCGE